MNKLFGTSKPKKEEPKPNINAPTLTETSQRVSTSPLWPSNPVAVADGLAQQGDPDQD